ncbi:hypothetical protein GZH47_32925 (plasmid) [Paenibacillus rhizovicinus]|uniref:Uncharacterized protein n=1 Tax=Paenibacillus rhizovicinus TaxID=2704463 RepID=A0A6C0PAZ9_9BACL|nr:hypothetical protein [Paenibacillus rhizovicinus]QHW35698.1 hypothetical protein GZH47_32925 [Paenibacillus rhizovicinus]
MPHAKDLIHKGLYMGPVSGGIGYVYEYHGQLYVYTAGRIIPHEQHLREKA